MSDDQLANTIVAVIVLCVMARVVIARGRAASKREERLARETPADREARLGREASAWWGKVQREAVWGQLILWALLVVAAFYFLIRFIHWAWYHGLPSAGGA